MRKKIFISQPMNGRTDEQVLQERKALIHWAKKKLGPAAKPLDYLARSIEFLAKADVAVFAPSWQDARGCRIEHQCAADYGISIMEVSTYGELLNV